MVAFPPPCEQKKGQAMNRIYKVVFNRDRGMLEVVSELARSAVKSGTKLVVATAIGAALTAGSAYAAITAGDGTPGSGKTLTTTDSGASGTTDSSTELVVRDGVRDSTTIGAGTVTATGQISGTGLNARSGQITADVANVK